jgi:hypothetical protein
MTMTRLLTLTATALALMATPALAENPAPSHPSASPSSANSQRDATPGPNASNQAKGKAYGTYCSTASKQHVAGQHGTPFSQCVTAMAKLANGSTNNPRTACKDLSKQHVAGQHGTPFSQCVSSAAKLLHDLSQNTSTTTTTS